MTAPSYSRKNIHAFDQDLAIKIGLKPAIVFQHVKYWLDFNVKNEKSWKKGRVWMYETQEDMAEFLGYLSKKEVRESLELLNQEGYLDREKLSANPFDQTWWYALPLEKPEKMQNSNSSYESNKKSPSEGHFLSPSEGNKKSPSIRRTIQDKEKEQQQAPSASAAAFSDSSFFYPCLEKIDIPLSTKIRITRKYEEKTVVDAVAWALQQKEYTKGIAAAISYACNEKLSPGHPELSEEEKKIKALQIADEYAAPQHVRLDVLSKGVEIVFTSGMKTPVCINFSEKTFLNKLEENIKQIGFRKKNE